MAATTVSGAGSSTSAPSASSARLATLFAPKSVAIVGASDRSAWSRMVYEALQRSSVTDIALVNPRSDTAHGDPTVPSLVSIGRPMDVAFVMTPAAAVLDVLEDAAAADIRNLVILSSGFGESGPEGRELEGQLREALARNNQTLLGPNTLGFINFTTNTMLWPAGKGFRDVTPGGVALITQSGALGGMMTGYAGAEDIGISLLCATGNEAGLTLSDIVDYAVDDEATKVIALFVESVRDPAGLRRSARRALEAGKPIVALKVGRSELAARAAATHTGSIVGDDAVVDVAFSQDGIIRVGSLEELIGTAGVLAKVGPSPVRGVVIAAISGGVCDIAADECERLGLPLPQFTPETQRRLVELLPDYASAHNPLDLTGAIVRHPNLLAEVLTTLAGDGQADVLLCQENLGKRSAPTESIVNAAKAMNELEIPAYLLSATGEGLTVNQQENLSEFSIPFLGGGLSVTLGALGRLRWWSQRRAEIAAAPAVDPIQVTLTGEARGTWSEAQTSQLLAANGVPVVPQAIVSSRADAEAAYREIGGNAVLKVVSQDIQHKTEVGGVRLNLTSVDEVGDAYDEILASVKRHLPDAVIDGIMVSPMRRPALELLVGITTDDQWGKVLTVGLGGVWIEILKDVSSRLLPVGPEEIRSMFESLHSAPLLKGARGSTPVDLDRVSAVVAQISAIALACGPSLSALEVNPLRVDGNEVEVLDALAIWAD
jgi:acyl-CoA synthetase (NDP forming)